MTLESGSETYKQILNLNMNLSSMRWPYLNLTGICCMNKYKLFGHSFFAECSISGHAYTDMITEQLVPQLGEDLPNVQNDTSAFPLTMCQGNSLIIPYT